MSQRAVESALGRLLTDEEFRRRFFQEPVGACVQERFDLTALELQALRAVDRREVERLAQQLDPRIVRASAHGVPVPARTPDDRPSAAVPLRRRGAGKPA